MLTLSISDAAASTVSATQPSTISSGRPSDPKGGNGRDPAKIRHMLFGTSNAVQSTILQLHQLGYAEPNDWSRPISTGRPGEVMVILTKRVA